MAKKKQADKSEPFIKDGFELPEGGENMVYYNRINWMDSFDDKNEPVKKKVTVRDCTNPGQWLTTLKNFKSAGIEKIETLYAPAGVITFEDFEKQEALKELKQLKGTTGKSALERRIDELEKKLS